MEIWQLTVVNKSMRTWLYLQNLMQTMLHSCTLSVRGRKTGDALDEESISGVETLIVSPFYKNVYLHIIYYMIICAKGHVKSENLKIAISVCQYSITLYGKIHSVQIQ